MAPVARYKAGLVAKGFHQCSSFDFYEIFSPVINSTAIRVILTLVVSNGWSLRQLDISNASLSEDVYMQQLQGFVHPGFLDHVCKLKKVIDVS